MMQRKPRNLLSLLAAVAVGVFAGVKQAEATFMLRLTQDGNSVTISDNNSVAGTSVGLVVPSPILGDNNAAPGVLGWSGLVGTYTVNVTTGVSKPILPNDAYQAHMDLNSIDINPGGGGTLLIELTDTDFIPTGPGILRAHVGGTQDTAPGDSVSFDVWKSTTNQEFAESGPIHIALGPFTSPSYSADGQIEHAPLSKYSMTLVATINAAQGFADTVSFDLKADNIAPEPASLTLWTVVSGLGAIMGWRSRRKSA